MSTPSVNAKARQAYQNADNKGKKLLEGIFDKKILTGTIMDLVGGWEDILELKGMSQAQFDKWCEGLAPDEVAYRQEKMIREVLNEGWVPNWKDTKEPKYHIWYKVNIDNAQPSGFGLSSGGYVGGYGYTCVGSRLVFKSRPLAEHAGKIMMEIHNAFYL